MYNFENPNLIALAVNISRIFEIATIGNHTVKLIQTENCRIEDISLLNAFYGFSNTDNPDMIIEVMYSPNDVLDVFSTKQNETLQDIKERLPKRIEVNHTLDNVSLLLLKTAINRLQLGVNDVLKIHSLSMSIAALAGSAKVLVEHVAEAITYRSINPAQ